MDWKVTRILAVACALCCLAALPLAASAATVYDGNISTTYITIFRDIVSKLPLTADYVFFRSGQYEYLMVVGDLDYNGSMFTGSDVTQYILVTNGNYNSTYEYGTAHLNSFSLAPSDALVYSNLGNYPDLYDRSDYTLVGIFFAIGLCFACYLISKIFDFTLRMRGASS